MKKESLIAAASLGLIIGFGILGIRRFLIRKAHQYNEDYGDFHRNFA